MHSVESCPPKSVPGGQITSQQAVLSSSQGRKPFGQSAFWGGSSGLLGSSVQVLYVKINRREKAVNFAAFFSLGSDL